MHAAISTVAFRGIDTIPIEVQVHIANGLPAMAIVGLADKAVAESCERVRAALGSIGLALPPKRIAVNLAPADVVKEGAHFDLPIALGLLVAMGAVGPDCCCQHAGSGRAVIAWRNRAGFRCAASCDGSGGSGAGSDLSGKMRA